MAMMRKLLGRGSSLWAAGDLHVRFGGSDGMSACLVVRELRTWRQRLVGLLGTARGSLGARPVLLRGCRSIHTFGMRYELDVAFVGSDGWVLSCERVVRPGRVLGCRGAAFVLERPCSLAAWPSVGMRVVVDGQEDGEGEGDGA